MANDNLLDPEKVAVGCENRKSVLHGRGGDPEIIGRDWGSRLPQSIQDHCITRCYHPEPDTELVRTLLSSSVAGAVRAWAARTSAFVLDNFR